MDQFLVERSNIYGIFFTKKLKNYFNEGEIVTIYSHYSLRFYTFDKNGKTFKVHYTDFGKIFLTKDEWRNKKILNILK